MPKHKPPEPCDVELKIRIPQSLVDRIERVAFAEGLKLSTTARRLLQAAVIEHNAATRRTSRFKERTA